MQPLATRIGVLHDFELRFDLPVGPGERGVANVAPRPGDDVWGALYRLTHADAERLDRTEGVDRGVYRRLAVEVHTHDGLLLAAFTYRSQISRPERKPSRRYLGLLLAGARELGLPDEYVERLAPAAGGGRAELSAGSSLPGLVPTAGGRSPGTERRRMRGTATRRRIRTRSKCGDQRAPPDADGAKLRSAGRLPRAAVTYAKPHPPAARSNLHAGGRIAPRPRTQGARAALAARHRLAVPRHARRVRGALLPLPGAADDARAARGVPDGAGARGALRRRSCCALGLGALSVLLGERRRLGCARHSRSRWRRASRSAAPGSRSGPVAPSPHLGLDWFVLDLLVLGAGLRAARARLRAAARAAASSGAAGAPTSRTSS